MWKILLAAEYYKAWVIGSSIRKEMYSEETGPFSLDDKCSFNDKEYTVGWLIAQMKRGSKVGLRFAEAVYKKAHNPKYSKRLPWNKSLDISDYFDAIRRVTYPR